MKVAKTWSVAALLLGIIAVAPIRTATAGPKLVTAPNATIFVANGYDVTAYPAVSSGDVAPIAVTPDMAAPNGIARDGSGRIYVANPATNTVTVYASNAGGNVPPIAVIGGANTMLSNPNGIALDASGKIYVLNGGSPSTSRSIRRWRPTPEFSTRLLLPTSPAPIPCLIFRSVSQWTPAETSVSRTQWVARSVRAILTLRASLPFTLPQQRKRRPNRYDQRRRDRTGQSTWYCAGFRAQYLREQRRRSVFVRYSHCYACGEHYGLFGGQHR